VAFERPINLVLADDHAPLRLALRADLEERGFVIAAEACDGPGAVEAAISERPDLSLLDAGMPGSGLRAAWEITSRVPDARVVILTGSRDTGDMVAAVRAGAVGYLLKDVDADRLATELHQLADGEVVIASTAARRLVEERRSTRKPRFLGGRNGAGLNEDEQDVLRAMGRGLTTEEIASTIARTRDDVRTVVAAILRKVRASSADELEASRESR
jgi:DNA-binding NarL/FixJ family response regulator